MRVSLPKNYKEFLTVAEAETARRVIKELKTWEESAEYFAKVAVEDCTEADEWCEQVLSVKAEICRDIRTNDMYFDGSGHIDIWLDIIAETSKGFVSIGCILSDVWQVAPNNHIYRYNIRKYRQV